MLFFQFEAMQAMVYKRGWLPALLLILSACFFETTPLRNVAGTSVGTGNPGKIKLGFKKDGQAVVFSGTVELYGSTQIPLPGFNPEPLARFQMLGSTEFTLEDTQLLAIPDSAWPRYSMIGDTLYRFRLVIVGDSVGAILPELIFDVERKIFLKPDSATELPLQSILEASFQSTFEIETSLTPLKPLIASINPSSLDTNRHNFLFVSGTGYHALSDNGNFSFPPMPKQNYALSFVSVPKKGRNMAWREDTAYIYSTTPPVYQGRDDTLAVLHLYRDHPMPGLYLD